MGINYYSNKRERCKMSIERPRRIDLCPSEAPDWSIFTWNWIKPITALAIKFYLHLVLQIQLFLLEKKERTDRKLWRIVKRVFCVQRKDVASKAGYAQNLALEPKRLKGARSRSRNRSRYHQLLRRRNGGHLRQSSWKRRGCANHSQVIICTFGINKK